MRLMLMMFMMLACLAHWRRGVAADAHDAGLSGWLRINGVRLVLMMLACPAGYGKMGWRAWLTGEKVLRLMLMRLACPAG